jgi:hypothetical protein
MTALCWTLGHAQIVTTTLSWAPRARKAAANAIRGLMRKITLALVVAALPTWAAVAGEPVQRPAKPFGPPRPVSGNPCAQYGAGYVKVEGSSTCIKIGGNVSVQAGGSAPR